jgi:hypothetical protein
MDTPTLIDALRPKYESLKSDFGEAAAERLREVVEHALAQIAGATGARRGRPARAASAPKRDRRSWTPVQKGTQRKKMKAFWAAKRKRQSRKSPGVAVSASK